MSVCGEKRKAFDPLERIDADTDPEVAVIDLQVFVTDPEVAITHSNVVVTDLEVAGIQSEVAVIEPEVAVIEPEVAVIEPEVAVIEPEVAAIDPEFAVIEPEVAAIDPEIVVADSEFVNADLEIETPCTDVDDVCRAATGALRGGRHATLMAVIERQRQENARLTQEQDRTDTRVMAATMPIEEKFAFIEMRSAFLKQERDHIRHYFAQIYAML
jgi:hypothetical protein